MSASARRARPEEMDQVMALRHAVFCDEQGVPPELEHDAEDATALHLVAVDEGRVIGTCRVLGDGPSVRLGRMAVAREQRGRGVGAALLAAAHELAAERGAREVAIHAQMSAFGFWERAGYVPEGAEFEEAGIPHVAMRRAL
ncbi:MAG TPA: GNAT family N-acetyltransferase [Miltoncostaea sp.]|nr:GNAT family N-acetyltransferase [Miltoncostaea sp.]